MAYFSVTDFNLRHTSDFCQESAYAHRKTGVCSIDGASAITHVSSVCCQIFKSISNTQVLSSRSVPLHGLRATDISRKSARHRNLSARSPSQALSSGHTRQHRQEHTGRCQREARLPHLHGFRDEPNPDCQTTLRQDRKSTRLNSSHLGISYAV